MCYLNIIVWFETSQCPYYLNEVIESSTDENMNLRCSEIKLLLQASSTYDIDRNLSHQTF